MKFAYKCMHMESIMLSETSQDGNDRYIIIYGT